MTRSPSGTALAVATALCLSASLALTGCGLSQDPPDPAPTTLPPTSSPTLAPTPEPEPEPDPIVFPATCEELSPLAAEHYAAWVADLDYTEWPDSGDVDFEQFRESLGPLSQSASSEALQRYGCSWIVSFHSVVEQWVFELPSEVSVEFVAALRTAGYAETVVRGAPVFSWEERTDGGELFDESVTLFDYAFIGNVWIAQVGYNAYYPEYLSDVIAVIRAANPGIVP